MQCKRSTLYYSSNFRQRFPLKQCKSGRDWSWRGRTTSQSPILIRNRLHVRRNVPGIASTYKLLLATTLQDVRLELAREEAAEAARGRVSYHNITLTTFLTTALDLEEQQYAFDNSFCLMSLT